MTHGEPAGLSASLARTLALDPDAPVIEFQGRWSSWGQLAATASAVREHVPGPGTRVGALLRNSPAHVGILAGLLEVKAHQLEAGGWARTTDLARIDSDGFVWILGRADQVIIRGGFKVHPDDVRVVLERDPRVRAAAVVGHAHPRLGHVPVAAVELSPGAGPVTVDDLRDAAAGALARYELPTAIRVIDALPRTPSGKVDLMAVRALFGRPGD